MTEAWLDEILMDAARMLGAQSAIGRDDAPAWVLTLDAETQLEVTHDAEHARLVIVGDIAEVSEHRRAEVYEMLLVYNLLWPATGGARMALDSMSGHAVLLFELECGHLAAAHLAGTLGNLADVQRTWRQVLRAIGTQLPDSLIPQAPGELVTGLMTNLRSPHAAASP